MHTCDGCFYSRPDGSCARDYDPVEVAREREEMEKVREEWRARFLKIRTFFRRFVFWRKRQ